MLNILDIKVTFNNKNEISTDVHYKDTNTDDYLSYDCAHPESSKLAKRIFLFVTDPEKAKLRLRELRMWL